VRIRVGSRLEELRTARVVGLKIGEGKLRQLSG
jgi:hypothetical protein